MNVHLAKAVSPERRREGSFPRKRTWVRQGRVQEQGWNESGNDKPGKDSGHGLKNRKIDKGAGYTKMEGEGLMKKMLIHVNEVAQLLEVSKPYAYKLVRKLNEELKEKGCIVIPGKTDRKYFFEKFYGTHALDIFTKEELDSGSIQNGEQ